MEIAKLYNLQILDLKENQIIELPDKHIERLNEILSCINFIS